MARWGLDYLEENAGRPRAAALTLDLAAQRLLTAEPPELRDPARARDPRSAHTAIRGPDYVKATELPDGAVPSPKTPPAGRKLHHRPPPGRARR
jgi:hypothetical protein